MEIINQASVTFGTNAKLDLFAQTVSDSLPVDETQAQFVRLMNMGSQVLYVGNSSMDSTTGYPVAPGESFEVELAARNRLWATYGATGTGSVRVFIVLK